MEEFIPSNWTKEGVTTLQTEKIDFKPKLSEGIGMGTTFSSREINTKKILHV